MADFKVTLAYVCLFAGMATNAAAQITGDYRSVATGDWETPGIWQTFTGEAWLPASASPVLADETIAIMSGHVVTVTSTKDADQIVVETGGTLVVASAKTLRIQDGAGEDLVVRGTLQTVGDLELEFTSTARFNSGSMLDNDSQFRVKDGASAVFDGTAQVDNADVFKVENDAQATFNSGSTVYNDRSFNPRGNAIVIFNDATLINTDDVKVEGSATVTFNSGAVYEHALDGGNLPKAGQTFWNPGSTCRVTGVVGSVPGQLDQTFDNFTWNATGQTANLDLDRKIVAINGTLSIESTGVGYVSWLRNHPDGLAIGGDLDVSGGVFVIADGSGVPMMDVAGNVNVSGGELNFTTVDGAPELRVAGNFEQTGGTITESGTGMGRVVLDGASTQTLHQGGAISNQVEFHVDNLAGIVLSEDFVPPDSLHLINGNIVTSNNKVVVGSAATFLTPGGYIDGTLEKTISGPGLKLFEVGTTSGYSPVTVNALSGTGELGVRAVEASHSEAGAPESTLNRYWTVTSATVTQADLVFNYLDSDVPVGLDELNTEMGVHEASAWSFPYAAIDDVNNTITVDGVSPTGDWTLIEFGTLPVEVSSITAHVDGRDVLLSWMASRAVGNAGFEIEVARTGGPFESMAWVPGVETAEGQHQYQYTMTSVEPGDHQFRLKQVDHDGSASYAPVVQYAVTLGDDLLVEPAYPNPFTDAAFLRFGVSVEQRVRVELYNALGRLVTVPYDDLTPADRMETVRIEGDTLPAGLYVARVTTDGKERTMRMMLVK